MKYQKIILVNLIVCSFVLLFSTVKSAPVKYFSEANKDSSCACDYQNNDFICDCTCQKDNMVKKCYVGTFISNPVCACCGDCTLNDMIGLFTNQANRILKLSGIFAMLLLVVGGIVWMTSGGSAERVKKGTDIIKGTVIGLIIIFIAFTIVRIVMQALGTESFLPKQIPQGNTATGTSQEWPACPVPPTAGKPWCYGCVWTGPSRGCQADEVKIYQDELTMMGCRCGTADGKYGSDTKNCTERFQKANNLGVDGKVGTGTYEKVFESLDAKPCVSQ